MPLEGLPKNSQDGDADHRASLIETCLRMNAEGLNQGTSGNVSVRHGNGMLITPSGVPYESMRPDMIVPMSLDGDWSGDMKPSSEWRMHLDIYRTRAEAEAVVHVHSTYATALSCLRRSIPAFHYMVGVAGGADIRCADYATFGTAELSEAMIEALDGRRACLLANHGQIAFGSSVERAYGLAVEVETLARQYAAACSLGEPVLIDGAEMQRILELFKTYGIQKPRS